MPQQSTSTCATIYGGLTSTLVPRPVHQSMHHAGAQPATQPDLRRWNFPILILSANKNIVKCLNLIENENLDKCLNLISQKTALKCLCYLGKPSKKM